MPYIIETKDGIVLRNIPDDIDPNSPEIKSRVQKARAEMAVSDDVAKMLNQGVIGRAGTGARASLQNAMYGIKDIVTDLSPEEQRTILANKQFLEDKENTAGKFGGFVADIASFALPGGVVAKGITKGLTMLPRAARMATGVGANAAVDAGLSAAYSTGDRAEAAKSGLLGSLGGQVAGKVLSKTLGGAVKPTDAARRLMDQNVQPTIGQASGSRMLNNIEQAAESVPILGNFITRARTRATEEAMRASTRFSDEAINAYRNVPGVKPIPANATGNELLKVVNENASAVYNDALKKAGYVNVGGDLPKIDNVDIKQLAYAEAGTRGVDDAAIQRFIDTTIVPKINNGVIDGPSWKRVDSDLGRLAAQFRASQDGDKRLIGETYKQLQIFWRQMLEDRVEPEIAQQIAAANNSWRQMLPLEKAAGYSAARKRNGLFTGGQLQDAVAALDRSRFDRASRYNPDDVARFANDVNEVLGNQLSNSGTADRLMVGGLLTGGGYSLGVLPQLAAGSVATGLGYTRPAQKFLLGGYDYQKALEKALRRKNTYFGDVGAAYLSE